MKRTERSQSMSFGGPPQITSSTDYSLVRLVLLVLLVFLVLLVLCGDVGDVGDVGGVSGCGVVIVAASYCFFS